MSLDVLAESAQSEHPSWDDERAGRVLATTLLLREKRIARAKLLRRSLAAVSAGTLVVLVVLRGAISPAGASTTPSDGVDLASSETSGLQPMLAAQVDAIDRTGDGGYGRD